MNLFSKFKKKQSTGIFIPDVKGYKELTIDVRTGSVNDITRCLGYHPDQVETYFGGSDDSDEVRVAVLEVFTGKVLFVLVQESVTSLNKDIVARFLKGFQAQSYFDSVKTKEILQRGIDNKSLRIEFLARVLNIKDPEPGGIHFVDSLNLSLYFADGYLVDFRTSNGRNEWANLWNQPGYDFVQVYEKIAKLYWGNDTHRIDDEINLQAKAAASVPGSLSNEFIELHRTDHGTINFHMLMVCHYGQSIDLEQFLELNHGRYIEVPLDAETYAAETRKYRLGKFTYEFFNDGTLRKAILS